MPRNRVQFQKGLSKPRFRDLYGTEEQCREALLRWRWPDGLCCPRGGAGRHGEISRRGLYQCAVCRHQVSLTAGTLFHGTKLPLTLWFLAIYHLTQSNKGISSIELGRRPVRVKLKPVKAFRKIESLARDALCAPPMPYSLLKLAEASA
jgi:transposase-like protein